MITGGTGGRNTRVGLDFEALADLATFLSRQPGYDVNTLEDREHKTHESEVFYNGEMVARIFKKNAFYRFLEREYNIRWDIYWSKQLIPDDSIYVFNNNTIYIIECKSQHDSGSVDEKLQTCHFKKKQYQKLLASTGVQVKYIYLLNNWFERPEYRDVLRYIRHVGCKSYFNRIPLKYLGLPVPEE